MSNSNSPFGLRPVGHLLTGSYNDSYDQFVVPAADGVALYVGDPVVLTGAGAVDQNHKYWPVVTRSTAGAGNYSIGVVIGFEPLPDTLSQIYRSASTLRVAQVITDPYVIYEVQSNGTVVAGDFGANADFSFGSGGSEVTGLSGAVLDEATVAGSAKQLRILGLSQREDNELGAYAVLRVMINEHLYKTTTGV